MKTDSEYKAFAVVEMFLAGAIEPAFVAPEDVARWVADEGDEARVVALIWAMAETGPAPVQWAATDVPSGDVKHGKVQLEDDPVKTYRYVKTLHKTAVPDLLVDAAADVLGYDPL